MGPFYMTSGLCFRLLDATFLLLYAKTLYSVVKNLKPYFIHCVTSFMNDPQLKNFRHFLVVCHSKGSSINDVEEFLPPSLIITFFTAEALVLLSQNP